MKNVISVLVLVFCFFIIETVHAASVGASIDHSCKFKKATFVVPAGQMATNLSVTLNSSWLPCQGGSTPQRIGARLRGPAGNVIYYIVRYYNNKSQILAGSLANLVLGAGTYTFEVPDGGKQTAATLAYTLKKGAAPNQNPVPVQNVIPTGWGTLNGEWSDPAVGSKAKIVQKGTSMSITNSFMWQGKQVVWSGSGTVTGNQVVFKFAYQKNKPSLWENGTMTLTRVAKNKLVGKWVTTPGKYSQNIVFIQTKSDDPQKPSQVPATKNKTIQNPQPTTSTKQKDPCPEGYHHRGGGECLPNQIKIEVR